VQSYEAYCEGFRRALSRRHRPRFSWVKLGKVCGCGRELPCSVKVSALSSLEQW
jgi:hypothetical protein